LSKIYAFFKKRLRLFLTIFYRIAITAIFRKIDHGRDPEWGVVWFK